MPTSVWRLVSAANLCWRSQCREGCSWRPEVQIHSWQQSQCLEGGAQAMTPGWCCWGAPVAGIPGGWVSPGDWNMTGELRKWRRVQGECRRRCPVTLGCRCHLGEYLPTPNVCSCGSGQDGPGGGYVAEALAQDEVGTAYLRPLDGMRAGYPLARRLPGPLCRGLRQKPETVSWRKGIPLWGPQKENGRAAYTFT